MPYFEKCEPKNGANFLKFRKLALFSLKIMVAELGFEPRQTESESVVLPLHNSAMRKFYYTFSRIFVNRKSRFFYLFAAWKCVVKKGPVFVQFNEIILL